MRLSKLTVKSLQNDLKIIENFPSKLQRFTAFQRKYQFGDIFRWENYLVCVILTWKKRIMDYSYVV